MRSSRGGRSRSRSTAWPVLLPERRYSTDSPSTITSRTSAPSGRYTCAIVELIGPVRAALGQGDHVLGDIGALRDRVGQRDRHRRDHAIRTRGRGSGRPRRSGDRSRKASSFEPEELIATNATWWPSGTASDPPMPASRMRCLRGVVGRPQLDPALGQGRRRGPRPAPRGSASW